METMVLQPRKLPERRVAIMWITTGAFFSLLASIKGGRFWLPVFRDLPDDARPLGVRFDFARSAFGVMIESPSLPVVLDGEPAPCLKPPEAIEFREFMADGPTEGDRDLRDLRDGPEHVVSAG